MPPETACGRATPRGSSEARTIPADSMATSVPAPIGDADICLSQRRSIVHPIADHRHRMTLVLQVDDDGCLSSGRISACISRSQASPATDSATWRASPVTIATRIPSRVELVHCLGGLGSDLVLQGSARDTVALRPRRGRRLRGILHCLDSGGDIVGDIEVPFPSAMRPSYGTAARRCRLHAAAADGTEPGGAGNRASTAATMARANGCSCQTRLRRPTQTRLPRPRRRR